MRSTRRRNPGCLTEKEKARWKRAILKLEHRIQKSGCAFWDPSDAPLLEERIVESEKPGPLFAAVDLRFSTMH
jgi:hypothetical protein